MTTERLPHDASYKAIFSNPDMVKSLLLDFVPESFIADFDFSTLEPVAASYVSDDLKNRHNDLVWRLRWKGQPCYIYILMEMQSTPDPWMAVRMLAYTALLWQDLIKKEVLKAGNPLPPVFPLVIYNGSGEWKAARDVRSLLDPTAERMNAYQPNMRYFLLDESRVSQSTLDNATGIAANVIRLERASEPEEILKILQQMKADLTDEKYAPLKRTLSRWFRVSIAAQLSITDLPEISTLEEVCDMLAERMAQWRENYRAECMAEGRAEGRAVGRAEGRAEGEANTEKKNLEIQRNNLLQMIDERFGCHSDSINDKIFQIDDSSILWKLICSFYKINSLKEFDEYLVKLIPSLKN